MSWIGSVPPLIWGACMSFVVLETARVSVFVLADYVCPLDNAGVITERGASLEEMPP